MSEQPPAEPGTDVNPAHWWRTLLAGLLAIAIGGFDLWHFGRDAGLSIEVDELLILAGLGLVAGVPEIVLRYRGLPPRGSQAAPSVAPPESAQTASGALAGKPATEASQAAPGAAAASGPDLRAQ